MSGPWSVMVNNAAGKPGEVEARVRTVLQRLEIDAEIDAAESAEHVATIFDAAVAANDQAAVFSWIKQMRHACGPMDPDLLITESEAAIAINSDTAALAAAASDKPSETCARMV